MNRQGEGMDFNADRDGDPVSPVEYSVFEKLDLG